MFSDLLNQTMCLTGCIHFFLSAFNLVNFISLCLHEVVISGTYEALSLHILWMGVTGMLAIMASQSPESNKFLRFDAIVFSTFGAFFSGAALYFYYLTVQHCGNRYSPGDCNRSYLIANVGLLIMSLEIILCILTLICLACFHLKETFTPEVKQGLNNLSTIYDNIQYRLPSKIRTYSLPKRTAFPWELRHHTTISCQLSSSEINTTSTVERRV